MGFPASLLEARLISQILATLFYLVQALKYILLEDV